MKKIYPLILLTFVCTIANSQTSISGGTVSGTWTLAGSPYNVQGSIQIPNDSTLSIQPGVTVNFQGTYKLNVLGRLLAIGTVTDTIIFTAANTTNGWRGIRFDNTPATNDTSKIKYCKLQYGKASGTSPNDCGGALYLNTFSKVTIAKCRISNCAANADGAGIYCYSSSPVISNNTIRNNSSTGTFYGGGGICCTNNSSPIISNNSILNNTAASGGGIFCSGSRASIINNTISNNSANSASSLGGGIFCSGDSLYISNNIISNNNSLRGGGIHCDGNKSTITNNTISNNVASAGDGGGINCTGSSPTIANNIITYNSATGITGGGGGIWCSGNSNPRISNNIISNNLSSSGDGGGINCYNSSPSISNNSICNNKTTFSGGGISCYNSNPSIINNTIANNSSVNGGGLYCYNSNPDSHNTILWGNTASTAGPQVFLLDEASDPNFFYSNVQGGSGGIDANGNFYTGIYQNNINADPLFVSPSGGSGTGFNGVTADWSLQNTSPCIDTGDPSTVSPATDIKGNPRVTVCRIDIGAYEYQNGVPFLVTVTQTSPILCNGNTTGALQATASGGTPPYSYFWNPSGQTTSAISNLGAGNYTLTTSFAGGCSRTTTFTITQPSGMSLTTSQTNINCNGNCIGSASVTPSGGTFPYTYLWSSGETTSATNNNLCSATYTTTVTDAGGCSKTTTVTIMAPSSLSFSSSLIHVNCNGGNNGSITVNASGGNSPYQYSSNGGNNYQASSNFSGLTAGTYTLVVRDNNGCQTSAITVTITQPNVLSISTAQTTADCYGGANAAATAIVSGGTNPYTYLWNPTSQTTSAASNLTPGNYSVSVTDNKGCTVTTSVTIVSSISDPSICTITVDSLSKFNFMAWDKTPFSNGAVDTFFIYRDTANNNYALIGKVPYDSLSQFIDTVRTLYAANGDPNATTWKYKLGAKDTCGNISTLSPFHKTLFIQNNGGNFTWNDYLIEGQPAPVPAMSNYLFQRDNLSNGTWVTIQTLSASSLSYTDAAYSTYQTTATWRVQTKWNISCTPTLTNPKNPDINATNLRSSKSNVYRANGSGIQEFKNGLLIQVYPNPTSGVFKIQMNNGQLSLKNYQLSIYNMYGECVYLVPAVGNLPFFIDISSQPSGVYFLQVKTDQGIATKKIIKE